MLSQAMTPIPSHFNTRVIPDGFGVVGGLLSGSEAVMPMASKGSWKIYGLGLNKL